MPTPPPGYGSGPYGAGLYGFDWLLFFVVSTGQNTPRWNASVADSRWTLGTITTSAKGG